MYNWPYHRAASLARREQRRRELIEQINVIFGVSSPSAPLKPKKSEIKKQLKIVVNQSGVLQDENNKLKDMKDQWLPFNQIYQQRLLIGNLVTEQHKAIEQLLYLESFYSDEKHNRFYYFKEIPISFP